MTNRRWKDVILMYGSIPPMSETVLTPLCCRGRGWWTGMSTCSGTACSCSHNNQFNQNLLLILIELYIWIIVIQKVFVSTCALLCLVFVFVPFCDFDELFEQFFSLCHSWRQTQLGYNPASNFIEAPQEDVKVSSDLLELLSPEHVVNQLVLQVYVTGSKGTWLKLLYWIIVYPYYISKNVYTTVNHINVRVVDSE